MIQQLLFLGRILLMVIITFALMRALLFISNADYFSSLTMREILIAFAHGIRFDLSIMVALLILPIFVLLVLSGLFNARFIKISLLPWQKIIAWLVFFTIVLANLALIMDILFFQETRRHVGAELLQIQGGYSFLITMLIAYWKAVLAFIIYTLILGLIWKTWVVPKSAFIIKPWKQVALFPVILLSMVLIIRGGLVTGRPLMVINAFISDSNELANLTLNGVYTGIRVSLVHNDTSHYKHSQFSDEEIQKELGIPKNYPFEQNYFQKKNGKRPNIILLTIESLNFEYIDALSNKNYGVTPYLDSLVKKSRVYDNFYAAGQRSIIGLQATWTGVPALLGFPIIHTGLSANKITQIGKVSHKSNYTSFFEQTAKRKNFNVDAVANAIGFDHYWGMEDAGETILDYPKGMTPEFGYDYESLMHLKGKLKQHLKEHPDSPVLAGFFSGTTHAPYPRLPKQFEKYPHQTNGKNGMLNSIAYTDWSIQQFIEGLAKEPEFTNTVFLITADHTSNNFLKGVKHKELFHIPLIIYSPELGRIKAEHIQEVRSQLDLMPTMMDLMNVDHSFSALGTSLLKQKKYPMINNIGYLVGTINEEGFIKTDLSKLIDTDLSKDKANQLLHYFLMINQRVAESLQSNKWAH